MYEFWQEIQRELRGMLRYRWPAMIVAWAVCAVGWTGVYMMPNVYEAGAQVFVDAQSRLAAVMGQVGVSPGVGSRVVVVRQAMLARPQLEKVASDTGLDRRAAGVEEREELLLALRENISVDSGRSSDTRNLYSISFRDTNREMAIAVVQELLDAFVEDVLKLKERGTEQVDSYLDEQLSHYSGQLSDAERRLANFKKQYVGLLPGENGGVFERLQAEIGQIATLEQDLQIEIDRREELRRQLTGEQPYLPETGEGSAAGVGVPGSATEATIRELETRRADLLLSFTQRHPDVVAIDEQLAQLYEQRTEERLALQREGSGLEGAANATNPVYQNVQIALNESGVRIAGLRSQIGQRRSFVTELNNQVNTIPEVEAQYAQLTRDYDQYRALYNEIMVRKERERMGKVGEERDIVSFNIIEPPAASFEPVAPRRVLFLFGVFVMGIGAGLAVAFVLHQLHPVFHDVQTLRTVTGQPVLGAIGMTWVDKYRHSRLVGMSSFFIVCGCLFAVFVAALAFQDFVLGVVESIRMSVGGES